MLLSDNMNNKKILVLLLCITLLTILGFSFQENNMFLKVKNNHKLTLPGINEDYFVTTWKTNATTTDQTKITIPTTSIVGTSYDVDWTCDGVFDDTDIRKSITHDYGITGTYDVCIKGTLAFGYDSTSAKHKLKLLEIKQWGSVKWTSMYFAFSGATKMQFTATDTPDLSLVTDMTAAFANLPTFIGNESMNNWNTGNVTKMGRIFKNSPKFNAPIGNWDTSKVTEMNEAFTGCLDFNQNLNNWNTGNVTNMQSMFYNAYAFNQPIGSWNTSNVTNMGNIFQNAKSFNQNINNWNTSNVINMQSMFYNASTFNQPIGSWNTSNVTNMAHMFYNANTFNQYIGDWNTSNVTNLTSTLQNASAFNNGQTSGESTAPLNWNISNVKTTANY